MKTTIQPDVPMDETEPYVRRHGIRWFWMFVVQYHPGKTYTTPGVW